MPFYTGSFPLELFFGIDCFLRVPYFTKKFLSDDYSSDNVKKRVSSMVDLALSDGDSKDLFIEQLSNFILDTHHFQKLGRSISSGEYLGVFCFS